MRVVPQTLQGAPELSAAEREALAVLAEHARERARLDCVWLFNHPPEPQSDEAVELLAGACSRGSQPLAEAAARAAIARSLRGDRRRFDRGRGAEAAGTRVATAARATSAVSAAGQPGEAAGSPEAEQALRELAGVALRLLGGPEAGNAAGGAAGTGAARGAAPAASSSSVDPDRAAAFGGGLGAAMTRLQKPPILVESRERLAAATDERTGSQGEVVSIAETDIGLALAVMARANRLAQRPRAGIVSVPEAVAALGVAAVAELAAELPDAAESPRDPIGTATMRLTGHAIAARAAAEAVAIHTGATHRDTLRLAALIHDVGKVALAAASGTYLDRAVDPRVRPDERVAGERRRMGIDHAGLGGIALGRLGLPRSVVLMVERHHAEDADGGAAMVRLADLLAHEARGDAVDRVMLAAAGAAVGMDERALGDLAYELARAGGPRSAHLEPSPLTPMQHKVLLGLRRGMTYKQIAADLLVSESTVRSHLHKAYERMGVVDRAQAVLMAQDRGWI